MSDLTDIVEIIDLTDVSIEVKASISWEAARRAAIKSGKVILSLFPDASEIEVHYRRGGETRSINVPRNK